MKKSEQPEWVRTELAQLKEDVVSGAISRSEYAILRRDILWSAQSEQDTQDMRDAGRLT